MYKTLQLVKQGSIKVVFLHNYGIVGIRRKEETKKDRRTRRRRRTRVRRKFPILYIQTPDRPLRGCYWYLNIKMIPSGVDPKQELGREILFRAKCGESFKITSNSRRAVDREFVYIELETSFSP